MIRGMMIEEMPDTSEHIIRVRVKGDKACFCGPKKDEPVSYPAPTPSAARGIMEAIFWKPAIFWHIRRIFILRPIRWFEMRVNEVKTRMNEIRGVADIAAKRVPGIVVEEERDQRHIMGLKGVDYIFEAQFSFTDRRGIDEPVDKFRDMFERRTKYGQCWFNPYLGRRDYPAYFEPAPVRFAPPAELAGRTIHLGMMLLDQRYAKDGTAVPEFFDAQIKNGVLVEAGKDVLPFFACQGRLNESARSPVPVR